MASRMKERKRTPISHKVIEKRRRDRINRCLNELGKTVPMALAKQNSGKLEKAEILEMTVQYLRALHSADFPRGREKGELLAEFANYFHYGYHECMKNLVHYLTTVERMESKDTKYARILAFLQSKSRALTEPAFGSLGAAHEPADYVCALHVPAERQSHGGSGATDPAAFRHSPPPSSAAAAAAAAHLSWHGSVGYPPVALPAPAPQHAGYLSPVHGLEQHYVSLIGHPHANALGLHGAQHAAL